MRFVGGAVVTRGSHFTLTMGRAVHARLTVERGNVVLLTPGGRQADPGAGQFVEVRPTTAGPAVTVPRPAAANQAAADDLATLHTAAEPPPGTQPENLAKAPEFKEMVHVATTAPGAAPLAPTPAPGVGSGMSAPFDLSGVGRNAVLLAAPNAVNIVPPVNSPEHSD